MKSSTILKLLITQVAYIFLTVCGQFALAADLRIGYYGGTFDPVTLGHRQFAERAIEAGALDILYVMPSLTNAKKPNALPYEIRKQMAALGFKDIPQIRIADAEIERGFASDRATGVFRVLLNRHPGAAILRLTGDDVISRNFTTEMTSDPAMKDIGFIIGERGGANKEIAEDMSRFDFGNREVLILSIKDDHGISSSQVRARLNEKTEEAKAKLRSLLAPEVLRFIQKHRLYVPTCYGLFPLAG